MRKYSKQMINFVQIIKECIHNRVTRVKKLAYMKKCFRVCFIIFFCFLFVACEREDTGIEQNPEVETPSPSSAPTIAPTSTLTITPSEQASTENEIQFINSGVYGVYDMTGEFIDIIKNNPIDYDYRIEFEDLNQSLDFSTLTLFKLEENYTQAWDTELNLVYNKLIEELSPEEKDILVASQQGWLQYHTKETEFVNKLFYLREAGPILGSQGKVQMQQARKGRIRERTLELMEYYSMLGKGVEFVYVSVQ